MKNILKKFSKIFRLAVIIAAVGTLWPATETAAETVSQKEALRIAHSFFNQAAGHVMGAPKMVFNGRKLTTGRLFSPFYVFNNPAGGFVIVSAENKAFPILGYSLKESFDPNKIGEKEEALLREYALDIEYIRYDSNVPEEAIRAWGDIPGYITGILEARYDATDPVYEMEEASEMLDLIERSGRADEYSSDMFTPAQWQEMMNEELEGKKSVALGLISGERILPAIVYGRKGDYYRIELDRRNQWLMRLMPTEVLGSGQIASLANPIPLPEIDEEEPPFAFHDAFIAETRAEEERRNAMLDDILAPSTPQLRAIGGGRYEIAFPEDITLARVYTLQGNMVDRLTFKNTRTGHLDLSAQPNGFYFAVFNGDSGKPYGFKLIR